MDEKTLRDEIAMSLPGQLIPMPPSEEAIKDACEAMGLDFDPKVPEKAINASLEYQAIMRYRYADMMLKQREVGETEPK